MELNIANNDTNGRRAVLRHTWMLLLVLCHSPLQAKEPARPNILLIITDQQFADGMSCRMGREWINTPGMDRLAKEGVLFERAYTANPLCVPARTAILSGHYPHQTGKQTNSGGTSGWKDMPCLGTYFRDAGYETAYFGKWHAPWKLGDAQECGFETVTIKGCLHGTDKMVGFLQQKHERPFMMVASFMNPHDICQWSRFQNMGSGALKAPPVEERPPLLPNHEPPKDETDTIAFMRKSYQAHSLFPVGKYTEDDWRRLSWGYYRLIEQVDAHVVELLEALDSTGLDKNTVVIFTSDHGDCHGAHRWNQKTVFYDESARIPLIIRTGDRKSASTTCEMLANTGVDLAPTMLDYASVQIPEHMPGKSLRPVVEGKVKEDDREYIIVQNKMVQCKSVDGKIWRPDGRMVRSKRFKYCIYSEGERCESLVDMQNDPGEMVNLAENPKYREMLQQHREYLREFASTHDDPLALTMLQAVEEK